MLGRRTLVPIEDMIRAKERDVRMYDWVSKGDEVISLTMWGCLRCGCWRFFE